MIVQLEILEESVWLMVFIMGKDANPADIAKEDVANAKVNDVD